MSERLFPIVLGGDESMRGAVERVARSDDQFAKQLPFEVEKSPAQKRILAAADAAIEELRAHLGLRAEAVPFGAVRVVKADVWDTEVALALVGSEAKARGLAGTMIDAASTIFVREQGQLLSFAHVAVHELLHYKSARVWHVGDPGHESSPMLRVRPQEEAAAGQDISIPVHGRRHGSIVFARNNGEPLFHALEEAIVETLSGQIMRKMRVQPDLQEAWSAAQQVLEGVVSRGHAQAPEEAVDVAIDAHGRVRVHRLAYPVERASLSRLVGGLRQRNAGQFSTDEEVMELFVGNHFTGQMLGLARLIDKTFGKGTFRKIGECGDDGAAFARLVGSLDIPAMTAEDARLSRIHRDR